MRYKLLLLVTIFIYSCNKKDFKNSEIIGHAGNGLQSQNSVYHENSLESIELALGTVGVDAVEIDVQLSADNELWLFHDNFLDSRTTGSGCINNLSSAELSGIHYATAKSERLVRLTDLNFENYAAKQIYLDLRHFNPYTNHIVDFNVFVEEISALQNLFPDVSFHVITRYQPWIYEFVSTGISTFYEIESLIDLDLIFQNDTPITGIVKRNSLIEKDEIDYLRSKNLKIVLFDIRAPKTIRKALKKNPDGIIVDDISAALIEKT